MAFASTGGTGATCRGWASVIVCSMMILVGVVQAADPDPLQDFCVADLKSDVIVNGLPCKPRSSVTSKDFTYTGFREAVSDPSKAPTGAIASLATATEWPGVNTQGVSHARLDFDIGGVIPLHTHPRAAETLFVLKGSVLTGFVGEDNVLYASTLHQGDVTLFPKALLHFQINVGKERAITFNTLTSQSPGFLTTATQIFAPNITDAVIKKSFGIDEATLKLLRASYPH